MLIALKNEQRIQPTKTGERAVCPQCREEVLSKCGQINIWHWAHLANTQCDTWGEREGEWHLNWKRRVPVDWIEVCIDRDGKRHRADIQLPSGVVVELQHSSISVEEIKERESFYGRMVWIFDVQDATSSYENNTYDSATDTGDYYYKAPRLSIREKDNPPNKSYRTFRWKHAKKHIAYCDKPVFLDIGNGFMFFLKKMYPNAPVGGWGYITTVDEIVKLLNEQKWIFGSSGNVALL